jgi:hypothetical protein
MKILIDNWEGILAVLACLWTALQQLAPITPTKLDDKVVAFVDERIKKEKKDG